jgi:hypothetical protein
MCQELARAHLLSWSKRNPLCNDQGAMELIRQDQTRLLPELGEKVAVPEIGTNWDPVSRWKLELAWTWRESEEHNNILEARTAVAAFCRVAEHPQNWGCRVMCFSDSQVTIGALSKGRSSVPVINRLARRMAALTLGTRIKPYLRYVRTHRNNADGPSRGAGLGYLDQSKAVVSEEKSGDTGRWDELPDAFYLKTSG